MAIETPAAGGEYVLLTVIEVEVLGVFPGEPDWEGEPPGLMDTTGVPGADAEMEGFTACEKGAAATPAQYMPAQSTVRW
jgi:hypothetical protein